MTLTTYFSRTAELGIYRGQLESGFLQERGGGSMHYDIELTVDEQKSKRVKPPDVELDAELTKRRYVPQTKEGRLRGLEKRPCNNVPLYRHFIINDRNPKDLAKLAGMNVTTFHRGLCGYGSRETREKIRAVLTKEERKLAGMKE